MKVSTMLKARRLSAKEEGAADARTAKIKQVGHKKWLKEQEE
jgi:hypothetical protein